MYIRRTRPWDFGRPTGQYALNKDSAQARGLVAWYPMAELGGQTHDWSGNLLPLTNNAATPWKADHSQAGLSHGLVPNFASASSQYLSCASGVGVPVSAEPLTIASWFWPNDTANNYAICSFGKNGGTARWQLALFTAGATVNANSVDGLGTSTFAVASKSYVANAWHHGVAVFSAQNARACYLNGANKGIDAGAATVLNTDTITIAARYATTLGGFLNGRVSDTRIYNRALTDEDALALYDPHTRWQLYYPLGRKAWMFVGRSVSGSFGGGSTFPALTVAP